MAQVFFPIIFKIVPASSHYHPDNTTFKCSIGMELGTLVYKCQLLYDGKIQPRTVPSFSANEGSDDLENVIKAFEDVKTTYNSLPKAVKTSAHDIDITEEN